MPGEQSVFSRKAISIVLAGIVIARFVTLSAYPIFDKSEARYAYIAELMVQTNNWITPFVDHGVPFWAKPILSIWLTAASFTLFGINAFAARLPAFLIYTFVGWLVFVIGRDERDPVFGLAAACAFASSAVAFFLGGTVLTDPALMLGVTLSMTGFWRGAYQTNQQSNHVWGYVFFVGIAIGVLAKGPIGAVLPGMSIVAWLTLHREWASLWRRLPWISGTALALMLVVPWYALEEYRTPGFLHYFFIGEHFDRFLFPHWSGDLYGSGRGQPRGTIWIFALVAGLPWSIALLIVLLRRNARQQIFKGSALKALLADRWVSYLCFWLLAPLVLFTLAANILIDYTAPGLAAFALLTADAFRRFGIAYDHRYGFIITSALVPVVFIAAVIAISINPGMDSFRSQAGIISTYKDLTAGRPSEIIYAFDKPISADFYSGGRAKFVLNSDGIAANLGNADTYFVVPVGVWPKLPDDLRQKLRVIVTRNHYVLLQPKATP